MEQANTHTLVKNFLSLQNDYQFIRRSMITKERFKDIANTDKTRGLDIEDESLKEPLIEHVGHLPIIATYFHEHIEHHSEVDLGRVLIMLSVHDIGETKVGDVFTFTKTKQDTNGEIEAARMMLPPTLLAYFEEFETGDTYDAQYAQSVDKLATVLHAVDLIGLVYKRFLKLGGTLSDIDTYNRSYMKWDSVLHEVFDLCYEQARRYEAGEDLLFPTVEYDID